MFYFCSDHNKILNKTISINDKNDQYRYYNDNVIYDGEPDILFDDILFIKNPNMIITHNTEYCSDSAFVINAYIFNLNGEYALNDLENIFGCKLMDIISATKKKQKHLYKIRIIGKWKL